jgi:GntR family transcriptional regulator, arabinose operon transcriptional repressor
MQITRIQQLGVFTPYQRIREDMLNLIKNQEWRHGEKIPTEMVLAAKYGVSRITIRKALKQLEDDKIIVARQGSGRIVAKIPTVRKKTKSIGIICNQFGSSYGEVDVIHALAEKQGYQVHLYLLQEITSNESLTQQLQQMSNEDISGIIILCQEILGSQIIEWNRYVPIVAVYHDFSTTGIPSFNINWRWIAYEAACLMFETGFDQQLVLLNDRSFFKPIDNMILDGFNYAHHCHGKSLDNNQIFFMPSERQQNYLKSLDEVYTQIAQQGKCAVFSYFNWPLIHLINYCHNNQLSVPDEISLIGAVDTETLSGATTPITAFRTDRKKLVTNAFISLMEQINNKQADKNSAKTISIYGELIKRSTTI